MLKLSHLRKSNEGSAAAEMALVAPLLIALLFGATELGYYFYNNHIVIKAVRDGARYASRRSFAEYNCPSSVSSDLTDATRNVTRTGLVASGGAPRIWNWTDPSTITVSLECTDNSGSDYSGIYVGRTEIPVVKVTATVPFVPLFSGFGFRASNLTISAESESSVAGI